MLQCICSCSHILFALAMQLTCNLFAHDCPHSTKKKQEKKLSTIPDLACSPHAPLHPVCVCPFMSSPPLCVPIHPPSLLNPCYSFAPPSHPFLPIYVSSCILCCPYTPPHPVPPICLPSLPPLAPVCLSATCACTVMSPTACLHTLHSLHHAHHSNDDSEGVGAIEQHAMTTTEQW